MAPIILKSIVTSIVPLLPKALSDLYDYLFNDEELQIKKKPDRTVLSRDNYMAAHEAYIVYSTPNSIYTSQKHLTATLNNWFNTNKSVAQMMRICKSNMELTKVE